MTCVLAAYIIELISLRLLENSGQTFESNVGIAINVGEDQPVGYEKTVEGPILWFLSLLAYVVLYWSLKMAVLLYFSRMTKSSEPNHCSMRRLVPVGVIECLGFAGLLVYLVCTNHLTSSSLYYSIRPDYARDIYITTGVNALTYLMVAAVPLYELLPDAPMWRKVAIGVFCASGIVVTVIAGMRCFHAYQTEGIVDVQGRNLLIGEMFTAIASSSICFLWGIFLGGGKGEAAD
ncbi:hypothetical protein FPSE_00119 [Fusarium pseudograminearum CS3096]|uniref:Uncharacterized protein n=1 Tax=Fusarium pseudograminearum (strain CS3096) TaxID=1028729 RepID=K3W3M6_FUSPC|nr:hypothetical protein FPSE_00119 [Fusarium pseudograminearum CS3096]EKJ79665.1 hypothetical protein FPSE_00119 [Fusarium pseudograminearum CS3096]